MNSHEFKAMISLLDDSDTEVVNTVQERIRKFGFRAIPFLEDELEANRENPTLQIEIENLLQDLQMSGLKKDFKEWLNEGSNDLLKGLWLVSRIAYPENDYGQMKAELNKIFMEVWVKTDDNMHPMDYIKILNDVIFSQFGFEPNVKNFHAIDNSLFNKVLENRKGNPVTLSCLYILLAERLGIPVYGVNLPFLFITLYDHPNNKFYLNPFNKGSIFNKADIESYLKQIKIGVKEEYFQPCRPLDIINRVLTNLSYSYQKKGDLIHQNQVAQIFNIIS